MHMKIKFLKTSSKEKILKKAIGKKNPNTTHYVQRNQDNNNRLLIRKLEENVRYLQCAERKTVSGIPNENLSKMKA